MLPAPETRESRLTPLDGFTRQMLLGTLLGDGSMVWRQPRVQFGRFQVGHGMAQEAYCRHKATILAPYVRTAPRVVPNTHFGNHQACRFSTVTSPVFEPLRDLCYRREAGRFVKAVTPEWAAAIEWPAIAYWYMDDGSLKRDGSVVLSTHGFDRVEVTCLALRLQELGIDALVDAARHGDRSYWTIRLLVEPARRFIAGVAPFIHASMAYKVALPRRPLRKCCGCGSEVLVGHRHRARFATCERADCAAIHRTRTREANDRHRLEQKRIKRRQIGGSL